MRSLVARSYRIIAVNRDDVSDMRDITLLATSRLDAEIAAIGELRRQEPSVRFRVVKIKE